MTALGGLRRVMPRTALAAGLAAVSMAGLPLLLGFIAKEQFYEGVAGLRASERPSGILVAAAVAASALLGAAGLLAGASPFYRPAQRRRPTRTKRRRRCGSVRWCSACRAGRSASCPPRSTSAGAGGGGRDASGRRQSALESLARPHADAAPERADAGRIGRRCSLSRIGSGDLRVAARARDGAAVHAARSPGSTRSAVAWRRAAERVTALVRARRRPDGRGRSSATALATDRILPTPSRWTPMQPHEACSRR